MASIRKTEDKVGNVIYKVQASNGRGRRVTRSWKPQEGWSAKTIRRELNKFAANLEQELERGAVVTKREQIQQAAAAELEKAKLKTVKQYGDMVFMAIKEPSLSENTKHCYRNALDKHIYPIIGDLLIENVTPSMITALLAENQKQVLKKSSLDKYWIVMSVLFKMAYNDDTISKNPMDKAIRPRESKQNSEMKACEKAYTLEELRYILKCLDNEPLKWQTYINLLADTGMRRGEASGLMWSDIDFKEGIITIKRNLQFSPGKGIYTTTPKNGKMRTVDVGDKVLRLLMMLRQEQSEKCISKYVFTQEGLAEPMHPTSPTHYFKVFSKKYEVEDFHPHKLRHTMASLAITNGADVVSVSARLGHSDSAVTLRMYAHANEESKRRAGDIFRNAIGAE